MLPAVLKILIADDDACDRRQVIRALRQAEMPCECTETTSIQEALAACHESFFHCAIVDYQLPGQDGLSGITALLEHCPHMAMIMSTGQGDELVATEAMKRGASDYLPKTQIKPQSVKRAVTNAVEKAILQKKVAEQRRELENFSRVLAHDLKSPMHIVSSFASLIDMAIQEGNLEDIAVFSHRMLSAAQRAGVLIDTLEQYTRADEHVVFERVDMSQVMRDTLSNLAHVIQERCARVCCPELPPVTGNAPQLIQLLQNLIGNGIKYCGEEIPTIRVAAAPDGADGYLISVSDNGIGIPEKHRREVFEPFKRLHGVGEYEGTGLGLATCRKIVERHGGRIWCESAAGEGSTFYFTLQAA